jgi:hypothetical protein
MVLIKGGKDPTQRGLEENIKKVRKLKDHSFGFRNIPNDAKKLIGSLGEIGSLGGSVLGVLTDTSDTNYQACSMAAERLKVSVPALEESLSYFKDTEKTDLGITWKAELTKDFYTVYRDFIFLCNSLVGVFASFMEAHGGRSRLQAAVEEEMEHLMNRAEKIEGVSPIQAPIDLVAGSLALLASFETLDSMVGGVIMSFDGGLADEYQKFCMDVDDLRWHVKRLMESTSFYSRSDGKDINPVWAQMVEKDGEDLVRCLEDALSSGGDMVRAFLRASAE